VVREPNKIALTELLGQGSQYRAGSTGLLRYDSLGRTERRGQPEKNSQNRTAKTRQIEQDSQSGGPPGQDCQDRTAKT
jgi:hypothetical protein